MKLAITGGSGFIGKWFLREVAGNNDIIILSRTINSKHFHLAKRNFRTYQTDYSIENLSKILEGRNAVLHLAASRTHRNNNILTNIAIDYNLFKSCSVLGIGNIVYCSTRGVYGNNKKVPWKENLEISPTNDYSLFKAEGELAAKYFNSEYGLSIKILRLAQVLGLGEYENSITSTFIKRAYCGLPLELNVKGNIQREYIYIKDLVNALYTSLIKKKIKGIFNLGSSDSCSFNELAKYINRITNNSRPIHINKAAITIKENSVMNSNKFYKTFSWRPRWNIKDSIKDIYLDLENPSIASEYGFAKKN